MIREAWIITVVMHNITNILALYYIVASVKYSIAIAQIRVSDYKLSFLDYIEHLDACLWRILTDVLVVCYLIKANTLLAISLMEKYIKLGHPIAMFDTVISNTQIGRSLVFKCFIMEGRLN